jgi:hypothetical protein
MNQARALVNEYRTLCNNLSASIGNTVEINKTLSILN